MLQVQDVLHNLLKLIYQPLLTVQVLWLKLMLQLQTS